ncbi:MAG: hypothetical protein LH605_10020 [Microbacteriaceae bacterium]|nr:hypothetical protein [Microbacteriaceae bacterium]
MDTLIPISRDDGLLDWVCGSGPGETEGLFGIRELVEALLHDDGVLDAVPRASHDQPVDGVVTPTRIVRFVG